MGLVAEKKPHEICVSVDLTPTTIRSFLPTYNAVSGVGKVLWVGIATSIEPLVSIFLQSSSS